MARIAKIFVCVDPAPMPSDGLKAIIKELKEDIKSLSMKSEKNG